MDNKLFCNVQPQHTPGPWLWKDVSGAGLQIHAPVYQVKGCIMPPGMPESLIHTYGLAYPHMVQIAHERWVQFEPEGWNAMQTANARLMAAAPDLLIACLDYDYNMSNAMINAVKKALDI